MTKTTDKEVLTDREKECKDLITGKIASVGIYGKDIADQLYTLNVRTLKAIGQKIIESAVYIEKINNKHNRIAAKAVKQRIAQTYSEQRAKK